MAPRGRTDARAICFIRSPPREARVRLLSFAEYGLRRSFSRSPPRHGAVSTPCPAHPVAVETALRCPMPSVASVPGWQQPVRGAAAPAHRNAYGPIKGDDTMHRIMIASTTALLTTMGGAFAMQATDLDINGDGFATLGEVRQVLSGFSSSDFLILDKNRDNRLSSVELQAPSTSELIGKYRGSMTIVHGLSEVDQNQDRFVTLAELRSVYPGVLDNEFLIIDINRDNRLSASELYAPRAQAVVTRYEMGGRMLVTAMQVDNSGDFFISFDELVQSYPGISRAEFDIIDANGDNRIASIEYYSSSSQAILDNN
ncbi:MAG: hypothetical protein EX266_00970 [Rhodobacteraceae bacterium]|nr:MAG: hypothetical protein EX266_00970 [Paracoccaceae bacterium]